MKERVFLLRMFASIMMILCCVPCLFASEKPPKVYVDEGACPFECCIYREWGVKQNGLLVEKPNSKKVVGEIHIGDKVQAITGIVYTWPTIYRVTKSWGRYRAGDRIYLLTNKGEGEFKIWFKGKVCEESMGGDISEDEGFNACEMLKKGKNIWWVKIKLHNGTIGWIEVDHQFNGHDMDQCG